MDKNIKICISTEKQRKLSNFKRVWEIFLDYMQKDIYDVV